MNEAPAVFFSIVVFICRATRPALRPGIPILARRAPHSNWSRRMLFPAREPVARLRQPLDQVPRGLVDDGLQGYRTLLDLLDGIE